MHNYLADNKRRVLDIFGREPETLVELADCVVAVANQYRHRTMRGKKLYESDPVEVVGFSWRLTYTPRVPTSHSHPIVFDRNKEDEHPGFVGRVWIRYKESTPSFGSDPLQRTCTYTGTGGIGGYNGPWENIMATRYKRLGHSAGRQSFPPVMAFSWDYRIYLSDWPKIQEYIEKQIAWNTLKDKSFSLDHKYLWEDADTLALDQEFMNKGVVC